MENPSGLCLCGCGKPTPLAYRTSTRRGHVKGQPLAFLQGHQAWKSNHGPRWIEDENGCWIWQRTFNNVGYGMGTFNRKVKSAHRGVYEELIGPIPPGMVLAHLCDNPPCVNPAHLKPCTQRENVHHQAKTKMSEADVADAYERRMAGESWYKIAPTYGITYTRLLRRVYEYAERNGLERPPSHPCRPAHAVI